MRQPSTDFAEKVREVWGNMDRVADIGIAETFRHEHVFDLDHDGQVENAKAVGILAGFTCDMGPEIFVRGFTKLLNRSDEE